MPAMNEKDYYAILGVENTATTDEIRRAFQQKARQLHPDVNKEPDAEERFKEVSEAYAVLSDSEKRTRYDAMRSGMPFAGAYPSGSSQAGYGSGSPFEGFPFGGGGTWSRSATSSRSYKPRAGGDVTIELDLDAESAHDGAKRGVTYQRYAPCEACDGKGSVEHTHATTCPTCGGAGRMRIDLGGLGLFGFGLFEVTCPECEGSGKVVADPCESCHGSGRVLTASEVVIDIPEDSHDGDEIRIEGMGNAGTNGREAGDFVCRLSVQEERLTQSQDAGFRLMGVGLPFLVIALFQNPTHLPILIMGAVVIAVGLAMVLRDGVRTNTHWLRAGGIAIVGGTTTGIIIGLLLLFSGPLLRFVAVILPLLLIFSFMSRQAR